jgi:hypothetical protein
VGGPTPRRPNPVPRAGGQARGRGASASDPSTPRRPSPPPGSVRSRSRRTGLGSVRVRTTRSLGRGAQVSRSPRIWPPNRPPGRTASRTFGQTSDHRRWGQKKRLNPAQIRSASGSSTCSIRATVVRSAGVSSAGTRDRSRRMPSGSASVANTRQPRSRIPRVSMPEPHPRSTRRANPARTWTAPRAAAPEVPGPRSRRSSRPR